MPRENYNEWTKKNLIKEIEKLKKRRPGVRLKNRN